MPLLQSPKLVHFWMSLNCKLVRSWSISLHSKFRFCPCLCSTYFGRTSTLSKFNISTRSWYPKTQLIIIESFKFRFIVLWLKFEFTALDKGFPYWPIKFKLIYGWSRIDQSDSSSTIRHFRSENAKRTFGPSSWQCIWRESEDINNIPLPLCEVWVLKYRFVFVKDVRSRKKIEYCRIQWPLALTSKVFKDSMYFCGF